MNPMIVTNETGAKTMPIGMTVAAPECEMSSAELMNFADEAQSSWTCESSPAPPSGLTLHPSVASFRFGNLTERYAEVLGHELAHAVLILGDLKQARQVEEAVRQTNEEIISQTRQYKEVILTSEMQRCISRRDLLLEELEEYARAFEFLVWWEISSSSRARKANRKRGVFTLR